MLQCNAIVYELLNQPNREDSLESLVVPQPGLKVALGRFHDGKAKMNWGGRGTSLALAGIVASHKGIASVEPLNGEYITAGFGDFLLPDKLKVRAAHGLRRLRSDNSVMPTRPFPEVEKYAERLLCAKRRNARADSMIQIISDCDELWMNGEGDFIMGYSGTLWRTLLTMVIAQKLGKPTVLLNSILSAPTGTPAVPGVIEGVGTVLRNCKAVIYRDPVSLELSERWFADVDATWLPDALFAWSSTDVMQVAEPYSADTEGLPLAVQAMLSRGDRIISISGSSVMRSFTPERAENISTFARELIAKNFAPVLVATSDEDFWLEDVARANNVPFVSARVPLRSGMQLLASSRVFVSGRYHPSILAASVGTPLVTFGSNSHKTLSLLRVLGDPSPVSYPTFDIRSAVPQLVEATIGAADGGEERRDAIRAGAAACADAVRSGIRSLALSSR